MSVTRISPQVQRTQTLSPYLDIYTSSPTSPFKSRPIEQHASLALTHAHPEPQRWQKPGGWGARHVNDKAPFDLWDQKERQYRIPNAEERDWISTNLGASVSGSTSWYMWIQTEKPPRPVPLTIGCMPVMFVGVGERPEEPVPNSNYSSPRVPDPVPGLDWPLMTFPTKNQNVTILQALEPYANVQGIYYMPSWTIVELNNDDGRTYGVHSLPGVVAGRTTLYHHGPSPFFNQLMSMTRARVMDPAEFIADYGPNPQDYGNYLNQPEQTSFLSPGCRLECSYGAQGSPNEGVNAATSSGVKLVNPVGQEYVTVAHHGFLLSNQVYHPAVRDGLKIGDVVDNYPELDIALIKLLPGLNEKFTNTCNFQAESPKMLICGSDIKQGSWSEVDGMSSGLVTLMAYGVRYMKPNRPPNHPEIDYREWKAHSVDAIFGAVNSTICEGMCGAPIVQCESGGVGGFFHLSDGVNCFSAHLDDIVAEGWQLAE